LFFSLKNPAVITPEGNATIAIPKREEIMLMTFPPLVIGYMSPYPTVVKAVVAQYIASKKLLKLPGSIENINSAEIIGGDAVMLVGIIPK